MGSTPKSCIQMGFSILNHQFWDTSMYGNPVLAFHVAVGHMVGWPTWDLLYITTEKNTKICHEDVQIPTGKLHIHSCSQHLIFARKTRKEKNINRFTPCG